jgi:glycosyltransferase involved in cell wall biosynthesis
MLIGIDASRAAVARRTGTENYSLQLIRSLLRLDSPHRYRLYTNGYPPAGLFWPAGHAPDCVEARSIPMRRLWTHLRLSGEMLARPPDVLFVPAHVLPLLHPRHSVVTVHDLGYLRYPEAHRGNDRRYLHWSTRWNVRQARAILADSAATRADLLRAYAAPAERIHVVYLGRDESLVREQNPDVITAARARYGICERYLLYVGTLQPRKNLARLIEAFARVHARPVTRLQLVLAGRRGWLYDDLFRQVEKLGLAGRVLFPGYVADEDLAALYSGAMGFVFPSLYEGFGIPVLEAQGCGVPVMASNNSSLPEVAGNGALLVDPLDEDAIAAAMARLIAEPELRAELTRRGFENVRRFSWEKCARETLAVIESVANPKSHDA